MKEPAADHPVPVETPPESAPAAAKPTGLPERTGTASVASAAGPTSPASGSPRPGTGAASPSSPGIGRFAASPSAGIARGAASTAHMAARTAVPPVPPAVAAGGARPELDRARATAFADTVDALYGVIADQRRTSAAHARRMNGILSIAVAVLVVTAGIGVAQTLLLSRLARQAAVQQQRVEQTMRDQQVAFADALARVAARPPAPAAVPDAASALAAHRPVQHGATRGRRHRPRTATR
ncbi:hypothetical protein CY652_18680 [Burkholderia sp. WAC0059]|nr:hypothetical protein CY652_18680 [Burkholderia sp. WAC0059]